MEINEHIDAAIEKIKKSLSDSGIAKEIKYYQSGHVMDGLINEYDISGRFPKIVVSSRTKKKYSIPFFQVISINKKSGF
jgi:hypothetical protein